MSKAKMLNLCLVLTSLVGYLEWGTDKSMFLVQGEIEVLAKLFKDPMSVLHPFTLLPMVGQILLIVTLFQKQPGKWLTFLGMGCIGILLLLMFYIGWLEFNVKIILSTLPFLVTAVLVVRYYWKHRSRKNTGLPE